MINSLLFWALPDAWTQFELLAPDLEEGVEEEMHRRFEGTGVEKSDLARVVALQVETFREFAAEGVVLLATYTPGDARIDGPPPGLSLTLALANRPTSGVPGRDLDATGNLTGGTQSAQASAFISEAQPFVLEDHELDAFTREARADVPVPGVATPLNRFQAQTFVLPKNQSGMAVITVTTFDPASEGDARDTARDFANTLCFFTADQTTRID